MFLHGFFIVSVEKYILKSSIGEHVACVFIWASGVLRGTNPMLCGAVSGLFSVFQGSELYCGCADRTCGDLDLVRFLILGCFPQLFCGLFDGVLDGVLDEVINGVVDGVVDIPSSSSSL